jgi:hypothetical protein
MMCDWIGVWVGEFGEYCIPPEVMEGVRLNKDGWPDKRSPAEYHRFMKWVIEQEDAARNAFLADT